MMAKLEEADRFVCLKNASQLKTAVTAKTQNPNPKCKTAFQVKNYCRLVLTTNTGNPVDLSDGERRFVLLATSGEKKGDFAYWDTVRKHLFTPEAGKEVANYLLSRNLENYNPRSLPPNEFQEFVVDAEVSIEERFIKDWDGVETVAHDLFRQYRAYCKQNDYPGTESFKQWVQWLIPLKRNNLFETKVQGHKNKTYYYKPDAVEEPAFVEE
jgi:hypothetical protein